MFRQNGLIISLIDILKWSLFTRRAVLHFLCLHEFFAGFRPMASSPPLWTSYFEFAPNFSKFSRHQCSYNAVDKRTRNNLYMWFDLVGGKLDQVESMWGQNRWGRTPHELPFFFRPNDHTWIVFFFSPVKVIWVQECWQNIIFQNYKIAPTHPKSSRLLHSHFFEGEHWVTSQKAVTKETTPKVKWSLSLGRAFDTMIWE